MRSPSEIATGREVGSSDVASNVALGHVPPQVLKKINLTVKISKISKEKHVLHFRLFRQKHAKTHVNRLKYPQNLKNPGQKKRRKILVMPPSPHFLATPLGGNLYCGKRL